MIRLIAQLMKLAFCILKHCSVLSFHLLPFSLVFSLCFFLLSSFPEDSITSTSSSSFQLCVGPPCVMIHQRQPEGMYFSYLSDRYFGGLRACSEGFLA